MKREKTCIEISAIVRVDGEFTILKIEQCFPL